MSGMGSSRSLPGSDALTRAAGEAAYAGGWRDYPLFFWRHRTVSSIASFAWTPVLIAAAVAYGQQGNPDAALATGLAAIFLAGTGIAATLVTAGTRVIDEQNAELDAMMHSLRRADGALKLSAESAALGAEGFKRVPDALADSLEALLAWMGQTKTEAFVDWLIAQRTDGLERLSRDEWIERLNDAQNEGWEAVSVYRFRAPAPWPSCVRNGPLKTDKD